jgi:hypothetical protein
MIFLFEFGVFGPLLQARARAGRGDRLEESWNSTPLLPPSEDANLKLAKIIEK